MKNEKKNRQGEPAMTQPKGANELNDDTLEVATGGYGSDIYDGGVSLPKVRVNSNEMRWIVKHDPNGWFKGPWIDNGDGTWSFNTNDWTERATLLDCLKRMTPNYGPGLEYEERWL